MGMNEIDAAIARILKCTADAGCPHEEACFVVAQWAQSIRESQAAKSRRIAAEADPDVVEHYAPDWSAA